MKTLRTLLILSIISLFMFWAFATVEVQTTTPLVNPDGSSEIVGSLRFILSSPDFGDPNNTTDTDYYVLIRVQATGNAKFKNIGHWGPNDITPTSPIYIALEEDMNMQNITQDPTAVRIVRIDPNGGYFDILFTKNLYNRGTPSSVVNPGLSSNNRIRFTIGVPECAAPTADINSFTGATSTYTPPADPAGPTDLPDCGGHVGQQDTTICVDFTGTPGNGEFLGGFWSVGLVNYHSDANASLGASYNTNYQPANPALAQEGSANPCSLIPNWPGKGDCGSFGAENSAPSGKYCDCQPGGQGQGAYDPCDGGAVWGAIDFGTGHRFTVTEQCQSGFLFEDNGTIEVTLNDNGVTDTYLVNCGQAWLDGGGLTNPQSLSVSYPDDHTMDIDLGDVDENRTSPYCVSIDLCQIAFDCCGVRDYADDVAVTVNVDYLPPNYVCGARPAPITNWQVGTIIGCNKPVEPQSYYLVLYFPYFPPVNDPNLTWWCGLALANYAAQPTDGGVLYLYEQDGDAFTVDVPALPGHGMWVTLLDQLTLTPQGSDTTGGDEPMSGILFMQVTTPPYTVWTGTTYDDGSIAGIDAFILMGDNTQAYGYAARHLNSTAYYGSVTAPIWFKHANK